jgi:Flp pilus assembly protein TadD
MKEKLIFSLALTQFNSGEYDEAISNFNDVIDINPRNAEAFFHRGNAYFAKGDLNLASLDHDRALSLNPMFMEY